MILCPPHLLSPHPCHHHLTKANSEVDLHHQLLLIDLVLLLIISHHQHNLTRAKASSSEMTPAWTRLR